jgi:hypothetical protein
MATITAATMVTPRRTSCITRRRTSIVRTHPPVTQHRNTRPCIPRPHTPRPRNIPHPRLITTTITAAITITIGTDRGSIENVDDAIAADRRSRRSAQT